MRWLTRLLIFGGGIGLAIYLWSRMAQEEENEEFDDEIPIEFDLPLESATLAQRTEAVSTGQDTSVGPGADLTAPLATDAPSAPSATADGAAGDDLTIIRGIGPVFQKRLNELGILTFDQLAAAHAEDLDAQGINGVGVDLASWIEQARLLAEENAQ